MRVALLLLPMLVAGCASPDSLGFARDTLPADPFYKEYRALLAGEHHEVYPIPVADGARVLTVGAILSTRDNGLPLPDTAPASLRVALLAPDGTELGARELDPRHGDATLTVTELRGAGEYLVRVDGVGASQPVDGEDYGAEYRLTTEVLYS